jgi:hypothetical protein
MQLARAGAFASYALTLQFAATLAFVAAAFPQGGIGGLSQLAESMADYIANHSATLLPFFVLNLYNASFAITAVVTILAAYELLADSAPVRMRIAVIAITMAGTLFLATGIIPIVTGRDIVELKDASTLRLLVGILIGTDLAATSAAGWAVALGGSAGLTSGRLPRGLSYLLIVSGVVEIIEFAVPLCLVLDPLLGTFWSLWLGTIFWRAAK